MVVEAVGYGNGDAFEGGRRRGASASGRKRSPESEALVVGGDRKLMGITFDNFDTLNSNNELCW